MEETTDRYDLTIVGGGPAGMYAAFYAGMWDDMKVKLIEAKDKLGGFLHTYSEKIIWDVGGLPPLRCGQLIDSLAQQAMVFHPTIIFNQQIIRMDRLENGDYELYSGCGQKHVTRTVLLAAGRGVTTLHKLEIEEAERFERTNLHYTIQDLKQFRGKHVLISGGGNSAVDWANEISEVASQVTVVHRKNAFAAMEHHVERMRQACKVYTPYTVEKLHSAEGKIVEVVLRHLENGQLEHVTVDDVIVNHGYARDYAAVKEWGLEIGEWGLIVSEQAETNLPGVFAAGDCCTYGSKVRRIAGAFTDAVLAVNSAKRYLDPAAPPAAYVSSHNERFKQRNKELFR